jgi:uncharacterized protein YjbJ (UPF0337 family)
MAEETIMNTSQVSGITKNFLGLVQERAGKFFGNIDQQRTGLRKQSIGTAEKNLGDARNLIKNALKKIQKSKSGPPD